MAHATKKYSKYLGTLLRHSSYTYKPPVAFATATKGGAPKPRLYKTDLSLHTPPVGTDANVTGGVSVYANGTFLAHVRDNPSSGLLLAGVFKCQTT
jgi:hypothetical protein